MLTVVAAAVGGAALGLTLGGVMRGRGRGADANRRREGASPADTQFRALVDGAPLAVWTSGVDGGCDWFNRAWLAFTGRAMEQELGDGWAQGVHPDDLERCVATYRSHFERRAPFTMEYRLRRHDGQYRWLQDDGGPRAGADGTFAGFFGSCVDVTALREAADAAREARNQLAIFVAHTPAAIAMMDRDLRYLAVSRCYLQDYRLEDQEVLGRCHYELFPEIPERWKEIHRRCLAGAVERCDADPFPRADGRTDWVRWEIRPWRNAAGEIGGIVLFSEVITAQREIERRAARAERLEALGTLVRGMSHEINSPLASVITNLHFAELELRAMPEAVRAAWAEARRDPAAELSEAIRDASEAAARVRGIVRDMSGFLPRPRPASPARCALRAAVDLALRLAHHELVRCAEVRVDLGEAPDVQLAEDELVEVLASLLVNAGQATGTEPNHVTITSAPRADGALQVTIADTGVGMTEEVLGHLFEPFFTTRAAGRGKGLGVPRCRGILEAAGGELSYESRPGAGTTVTLVLPRAADPR